MIKQLLLLLLLEADVALILQQTAMTVEIQRWQWYHAGIQPHRFLRKRSRISIIHHLQAHILHCSNSSTAQFEVLHQLAM